MSGSPGTLRTRQRNENYEVGAALDLPKKLLQKRRSRCLNLPAHSGHMYSAITASAEIATSKAKKNGVMLRRLGMLKPPKIFRSRGLQRVRELGEDCDNCCGNQGQGNDERELLLNRL